MQSRRLGIYLNDHLAGATIGIAVAGRCQRENDSGELGSFLRELVSEIAEDRVTLERLMDRLAIRPSRAKIAAAWGAEKLGRLKLNGQLTGYSPLSRLVELEGLAVGIEGKRCLWLALAPVAAHDERLRDFDFDELGVRARSQRERLEPYRADAAAKAFL